MRWSVTFKFSDATHQRISAWMAHTWSTRTLNIEHLYNNYSHLLILIHYSLFVARKAIVVHKKKNWSHFEVNTKKKRKKRKHNSLYCNLSYWNVLINLRWFALWFSTIPLSGYVSLFAICLCLWFMDISYFPSYHKSENDEMKIIIGNNKIIDVISVVAICDWKMRVKISYTS